MITHDAPMDRPSLPSPTSRSRRGRWLGGVCAGLATRWGQPASTVRGGFVAATFAFGLGPLVYLACWLILPAEGEDGLAAGPRGILVLAQTCGALLALVALAFAGALAALFGFGWVVVAVAAAVLAGMLATWPRVGPGWALLPIGALVLPGLAFAATDVGIEPQTASVTVAPRTLPELPRDGLRSGLGLLTVDLRRTALPPAGRVGVRIEAGVRRTLVALPHDRCVKVEVRQREVPLALRIARSSVVGDRAGGYGLGGPATPGAQLFGDVLFGTQPTVDPRGSRGRGPTLVVDYASDGGELVIRDYPDDVDPASRPDWPGYPVTLEERPDTTGVPRVAARRLVRAWRARLAVQRRSQRRIERDLAGPCSRTDARR